MAAPSRRKRATKMIEFRPLASSSDGCCYILSSTLVDAPLLIDAGLRFRAIQEALDFRVTRLAGGLISHCHGDHSKSVVALMNAGVDLYASPETWEELGIKTHRAKKIGPDRAVQIGPWNVQAFDAVHDAPGTLGFLIATPEGKRLLYLTDTAFSKYRFDGMTHVAIECNFSKEILRNNAITGVIHAARFRRTMTNHMSLERLLTFLAANDLSAVEEIHLLHLSDANSDEEAFKLAVQKATGKPVYIAAKFAEGAYA